MFFINCYSNQLDLLPTFSLIKLLTTKTIDTWRLFVKPVTSILSIIPLKPLHLYNLIKDRHLNNEKVIDREQECS